MVGCYRDELKVTKRGLPYVFVSDKTRMTPQFCQELCAKHQFRFSGVQWGEECYCGRALPPYPLVNERLCNKPCTGDISQQCGGSQAMNVYEWKAALPTPPEPGRCLLSLVMILKDEAHTIENTLRTVRDIVDRWFILDTGSTDGTQAKVQAFMKGVKGQLFEEPFVDYGATRNRILNLAAEQPDSCVFALMLSADEQVTNPQHLRSFLEDVRYADGPQHGAYPVLMNSGIDFDSVRVSRTDVRWRYVGRVHEYLTSPEKKWVDLYRPVPEVRVMFRATDGDRRFKSQYKILDILLDDFRKNANDTRALFYIARTYSTVGNHSESLRFYELLQERSKWKWEVYHGKVMRFLESKSLPDFTWQQRHEFLIDAFQYKPDDMDAPHLIAEDHFNNDRFQLAYVWALRAAQLPKPEGLEAAQNILLRDTTFLYEWEGNRLLGFAAERVGEYDVCVDALEKVMAVRSKDSFAERTLHTCRSHQATTSARRKTNTNAPETTTTTTSTSLRERLRALASEQQKKEQEEKKHRSTGDADEVVVVERDSDDALFYKRALVVTWAAVLFAVGVCFFVGWPGGSHVANKDD